jgi:hypothetical protein
MLEFTYQRIILHYTNETLFHFRNKKVESPLIVREQLGLLVFNIYFAIRSPCK